MMDAKTVLETAAKIVTGERQQQHGAPENSFADIAAYWSLYLDYEISSHDVAVMMVLLKIARAKNGASDDHYVDMAGYAALASQLRAPEITNDELVEMLDDAGAEPLWVGETMGGDYAEIQYVSDPEGYPFPLTGNVDGEHVAWKRDGSARDDRPNANLNVSQVVLNDILRGHGYDVPLWEGLTKGGSLADVSAVGVDDSGNCFLSGVIGGACANWYSDGTSSRLRAHRPHDLIIPQADLDALAEIAARDA